MTFSLHIYQYMQNSSLTVRYYFLILLTRPLSHVSYAFRELIFTVQILHWSAVLEVMYIISVFIHFKELY